MMIHLVARSISRPVRERLHRSRQDCFDARVLAVFESACDLVTHDGDVIALVSPQIGDGPLNVVVGGAAALFAQVHTGAPVRLEKARLCVSGLAMRMLSLKKWNYGQGRGLKELRCIQGCFRFFPMTKSSGRLMKSVRNWACRCWPIPGLGRHRTFW